MYKDLFLGIRQYDCKLSQDTFDKIEKIALETNNDENYPGFQSMFCDIRESILKEIEESFVDCCSDYYKVSKKYGTRYWFYQDWKDNPHRDGQYWHDHIAYFPNLENPMTFYGLSGIMYLTLPDDSTTTGFSPNADNRTLGSHTPISNMLYLPKITKKWFIFPNFYPHFPGICETENRRITVGADYWLI